MVGELNEFVMEKADISNTRYGRLVSRDNSIDNKDVGFVKGKCSTDYDTAKISYESTSNYNVPLHDGYGCYGSFCLVCSGNHSLDQCQVFEDKDVSERKEFTLRYKLFNFFLETNHAAENFWWPRSCTFK